MQPQMFAISLRLATAVNYNNMHGMYTMHTILLHVLNGMHCYGHMLSTLMTLDEIAQYSH